MLATLDQKNRLIDSISYPSDLKKLSKPELNVIAHQLRDDIIQIVSRTGGHLGAGLGVIELTVALHYVFDTPKDQLIWDIGHQAYPHKYLTGRKDKLETIRQPKGLSGFLKRSESEYDVFGAGHSSTSISAALGIAIARDIKQDDYNVIAVIGDGALTAGMAYEAMNNAAQTKTKMIVVLNDNEMSIAPNVGAMHKYLNKLTLSRMFLKARAHAKHLLHKMPHSIESLTKKAKKYTKDLLQGGNLFEELGFHYVGPIDGHDLEQLVSVFTSLRDDNDIESPILVHIKTQKGKGFDAPNACDEKYHAVNKFDLSTKVQTKPTSIKKTYTQIASATLLNIARDDNSVVAITAAMPSGTGLTEFASCLPNQFFDVGIAEQHAVTFAAGLSTKDIKPFCLIYSTFLQRAYDQIVHDVAIQSLPVRFLIDRAGFVGGDGPTHGGVFDIAYLANLPNMVVMAASNEHELARMVLTCYKINDRPSAVRYPRGNGVGLFVPDNIEPIEIGKAELVQEGVKVAIFSLGTRLEEAKIAASTIKERFGFDPTVINARFVKPMDTDMIDKIAQTHEVIISIEEGMIGGFSAHFANYLSANDLLHKVKYKAMHMPDIFIEHNDVYQMYNQAGLNALDIVKTVEKIYANMQ